VQERTPNFYLCHFPFSKVLVYTRFFIKRKRDNDSHVKSVRTTIEIPVERSNNNNNKDCNSSTYSKYFGYSDCTHTFLAPNTMQQKNGGINVGGEEEVEIRIQLTQVVAVVLIRSH
jgi:hypothetical protein